MQNATMNTVCTLAKLYSHVIGPIVCPFTDMFRVFFLIGVTKLVSANCHSLKSEKCQLASFTSDKQYIFLQIFVIKMGSAYRNETYLMQAQIRA